jgi:hypothetical protein
MTRVRAVPRRVTNGRRMAALAYTPGARPRVPCAREPVPSAPLCAAVDGRAYPHEHQPRANGARQHHGLRCSPDAAASCHLLQHTESRTRGSIKKERVAISEVRSAIWRTAVGRRARVGTSAQEGVDGMRVALVRRVVQRRAAESKGQVADDCWSS